MLFLLLDKKEYESDKKLAAHICYVHKHSQPPTKEIDDEEMETLSAETLRSYISLAKKYRPFVPRSLTEFIVENYVGLREDNKSDPKHYITARQIFFNLFNFI